MPVWHERTKALREAGKLALVGITEEQHPDRCALFAQWQGFDWPILWDPFNLTGSAAVPVVIAIDEHGIVRTIGLSVERLDGFVQTQFAADEPDEPAEPLAIGVRRAKCGPPALKPGADLDAVEALSRLLWYEQEHGAALGAPDFAQCIAILESTAAIEGAPAAAKFRQGVALRLRYDSPVVLPQDFQGSLDAWSAALRADPAQYIWRRRIQQWGPRLDKPYPFYGWIETSTREIRERGEEPLALRVPLTTSEVSGKEAEAGNAAAREHPDPDRKVTRDSDGQVTVECAIAPHTSNQGDAAKAASFQIHLALRPSTERAVHWGNDAGPTEVWIDDAERLGLPRADFVLQLPDTSETSAETRRVDFTIAAPAELRILTGTAFYFVCAGRAGECRFLAQDFEVRLPAR